MSELARMFAGVTLLIVPIIPLYIAYVYRNKRITTDQQKTMLLAAASHSAVLIVLSLLAQVLLDSADLVDGLEWVVRFTFPAVAFLMSLCNLNMAVSKGSSRAFEFTRYRVLSLVLFCFSVIVLGIGLVNH